MRQRASGTVNPEMKKQANIYMFSQIFCFLLLLYKCQKRISWSCPSRFRFRTSPWYLMVVLLPSWGKNKCRALECLTELFKYDWFCYIHKPYVFIIQFPGHLPFILWFSLIFHCLKAGFVPCPWGKLMVPDSIPRDCEHLSLMHIRNHELFRRPTHYSDIIMSAMASQITSVSSVCSTFCSSTDQIKHQSSASLAFVRVTPDQGTVTRKMSQFDDVMDYLQGVF